MKIAYCSLLLPPEKKIEERAKKHLSGISLHKFTSAIIAGLDANLKTPVKVFNIINTLNYPDFPKLIFHNEEWSHTVGAEDVHIGYINIFGIKYITQANTLYKALDKWAQTLNGERFILCVHHNYYPMLRAALRIKRKYDNQVITCLISGDIPGKFGLKSQYKDTLKQRMIEKLDKSILSMVKKFDSFVFQTKYMAEGFDVINKPVCVLECCYQVTDYSVDVKEEGDNDNKKIIFYAGSLRKEYDVLHLVRAFELIKEQNFELWLAGGGNAVGEIKTIAAKDNRIKYLGFIPPEEVLSRQEKATVLVSPRLPNHEYVKYSFPSKTMECLASGKPFVAHNLPCEPKEYSEYIQYVEGVGDKDLADKLIEVCNLDEEVRSAIGEKGKKFIIEQKNPRVMCKRIVDFWSEL
jgi:glycosyltransferase involved in cell wall biosynthesis